MLKNIKTIPAAGALLALLTACGGTGDGTGDGRAAGGHDMTGSTQVATSTPATTSASSAGFNDADVMFAQMMIPHHEQAVDMAELAEGRASDQEIKDLAAKIKAAQDPEIRTMRGWLTAWGKPLPSGGMGHDMPGMMSAADLRELESAQGEEFDRRFAELMIAHHEGAIEMARTEQAQGADPEAKELAKTIETAQRAEVAQLRAILDRL
ncbi:DUF305 domain-containing protein [Nonomuraea sp. NN258]|uniref:DUF305 domain-containing protein n=1 Tax=Nonomuraea antri TaxID=2730852 RepID=UPI001567CC3C|nr:DUF305 domain-containing protein [Nonomuraea antri]NRQ32210.1 DUF305 domain-containing protein [Nonomuraea antri]